MASGPLVDMPVVVGPYQSQGQFFVFGARKERTRKLWKAGETHLREYAIDVHIPDPLVDVVATRTHLVVCRGLHAILFGGTAHHGVEPDIRQLPIAEDPHFRPILLANASGGSVLVLAGQMIVKDRGRFDDVVVDADEDHVVDLHLVLPLFSVEVGDRRSGFGPR